ncbi:MAG: hypothetical protein ACTSRU_17245 [Candidatus Hodarchaeales archaeon]
MIRYPLGKIIKIPEHVQEKSTITCRKCGQLWSCEFLEREVGLLKITLRIDKGESFYDFIERRGFIAAVPLDKELDELKIGELVITNCPGCEHKPTEEIEREECLFCVPFSSK